MSLLRDLHWLPAATDFRDRLVALEAAPDWTSAILLARMRLDFLRTNTLDKVVARAFAAPPEAAGRPLRLAILGSASTRHLQAGLRIAALRRGMHLSIHEAEYGQYRQTLADRGSELDRFAPDAVLFALDADHLAANADPSADAAAAADAVERTLQGLAGCWRTAREVFGCLVLQQTVLPVWPPLMGSGEHLIASPAGLVARLNARLRDVAGEHGVSLVAVDERAARDGIGAWHDPALWHQAKQEVSPAAAPIYGDLVARVLAAHTGHSAKVLVLDLDDTLWGGVIGDVGLGGIVLGQGSAAGEAFLAVQRHAKALAARGVILAVCSKNDAAVAQAPFEQHPDMLLRLADIACFVASWDDKAVNIARIASELNVGLDALVLLDDNPFERERVRSALPMVAVPELPDEPALFPQVLADAGYFEAVALTADDRARSAQYQANRLRAVQAAQAPDLQSYLASLDMRLLWSRVDALALPRVAQLINKTNQFNLTTIRYTESEVAALAADPGCLVLQFRLIDRLCDNGVIAVVIGRLHERRLIIENWLMSCRVLGREVERATLAVVAECARSMQASGLAGTYRPSGRNAMVSGLLPSLGFAASGQDWCYVLDRPLAAPPPAFIRIEEAHSAA